MKGRGDEAGSLGSKGSDAARGACGKEQQRNENHHRQEGEITLEFLRDANCSGVVACGGNHDPGRRGMVRERKIIQMEMGMPRGRRFPRMGVNQGRQTLEECHQGQDEYLERTCAHGAKV